MGCAQIAAGVWKIDLGKPEELTPLSILRSHVPDERLAGLPIVGQCPVESAAIMSRAARRGFEVRLPLNADEKIYGLGLQLLSFNQTGKKKTLRVNSDPHADLGDSHAPVPFYVSTAGYAVLVDTARYATFYCGSAAMVQDAEARRGAEIGLGTESLYARRQPGATREMVVEVPGAEGVSLLVFGGPDLRDAVRRYNLFSGGGSVPPRWALGVWYRPRADFGVEEVETLAEQLRRERMPCDVLGLEPGWQSHAYACSHVWNARFPDPGGLVARLRQAHFRINLWTHAFTARTSPLFEELRPYSGDHTAFGGLVPDFLTLEATRIFSEQYRKIAVELGISGLKLDECDNSDFIKNPWSFPEYSRFPSGADGEQMHSLFGVLQQRLVERIYQDAGSRGYGLVRSSHAFAAPLPFVLYSDLYDHRQFVRGIVTAPFSGLLWCAEVREATSGEDLLRRLQTAAVSPLTMINAWYIKHPPWKQWTIEANNEDQFRPDWPRWQDQCREVLEWRMRMVPYLHSAYGLYAQEGLPPFRPLVMDYSDEEPSWDCDNQILIGDRLMAAPLVAGEAGRRVWLPPGVWFDFWSGERQPGGRTIEVPASGSQLPLFVKDGSVLPLAEPTLHTEDPAAFHLEVRVYGSGALPANLLEESAPAQPFDPLTTNVLELRWDPAREEVIGSRRRADLTPLYRIVRQVRIG